MATGQGTILFDFGSAPGANTATTVVSDTGVDSASVIEIYLMGTDSTSTHNYIEHQMLPLSGIGMTVTSITPATGFTAQIMSSWRLTGVFQARYVWAG